MNKIIRVVLDEVEKSGRGWVKAKAPGHSWLVTVETAGRLGLESGLEVDVGSMNRVAEEEQLPRARDVTVSYLARAGHSRMQLEAYLSGKGYLPQVIAEVLDWAENLGLVDDRRYAGAFVESHTNRSPMGRYRLRMELIRRGIAPDIVSEILEGREDRDLFDRLVKEVRKKYGGMERRKALRRASSYMRRRGFGFDLASRVLEEIFGDGGDIR